MDLALDAAAIAVLGADRWHLLAAVDGAVASETTLATNVQLQLTFPPDFFVQGATLAGASCSVANSMITCDLGDVAVGEERAIDLRVTGNSLGSFPVQGDDLTAD